MQGSLWLSDWGGAVGHRGSHARHQQQGRSGGPQLLDTMSLQLQVFKNVDGLRRKPYLYVNTCFSLEQGTG